MGGGPAGLPLAVVLGGWHPYYRASHMFNLRYPQLAHELASLKKTLLSLDFKAISRAGIRPVELFRLLHHPRQMFEELEQIAMEFRREIPIDYLLITQEKVGGLWNNVPQNLLTLSPGQWMEFAFHPLAQHAAEQGIDMDVNALINKSNLIGYYHSLPKRFGQSEHIHTDEKVVKIQPHERGFLVTSNVLGTHAVHQYTCKYLVYAVGQRCDLRRLGVAGEDLPFVANSYDKPEDFPGDRVVVVGGGRSADWAATELYDAGKQVFYVMRQSFESHWRLISNSRRGLPYYARIAEIMETHDPRFQTFYQTHVSEIRAKGHCGLVTIEVQGANRDLETEHVILQIGGRVDYSLFEGFAPFEQVEKYDPYRFQLDQVVTHEHNHEVVNIPNLYMGGYLASGVGLVVIAMHGATYAIAGDILQKEGSVRL